MPRMPPHKLLVDSQFQEEEQKKDRKKKNSIASINMVNHMTNFGSNSKKIY